MSLSPRQSAKLPRGWSSASCLSAAARPHTTTTTTLHYHYHYYYLLLGGLSGGLRSMVWTFLADDRVPMLHTR